MMKQSKKLKVLDLFSGIGGFSRGLESTEGFETVAFCEIDEPARQVLKKHWPNVQIFKDIKEVGHQHIFNGECYLQEHNDTGMIETDVFCGGEIDIICGGYPCTGHSVAGKKEGFANEASGLWEEYARLIKEVNPRYVIIENSPNLRNTGLAQVLETLDALEYNAEWSIVSAYSIGSPHQRERLYLVAWRRDIPYCDPFRSWNANTKEAKEKSKWWSKGWIKRSDLFGKISSIKSKFLRIDDGLSRELHKDNEERIKQLGNSIVPQTVELIGQRILEVEGDIGILREEKETTEYQIISGEDNRR